MRCLLLIACQSHGSKNKETTWNWLRIKMANQISGIAGVIVGNQLVQVVKAQGLDHKAESEQ